MAGRDRAAAELEERALAVRLRTRRPAEERGVEARGRGDVLGEMREPTRAPGQAARLEPAAETHGLPGAEVHALWIPEDRHAAQVEHVQRTGQDRGPELACPRSGVADVRDEHVGQPLRPRALPALSAGHRIHAADVLVAQAE